MEMINYTLLDHIRYIYEMDAYPGLGLVRTTPDSVDLYPRDIPEDFYNMVSINKVDQEGVHWDLKLNEFEGMFGSITSGSKTIKHGEKYKHRHEFVAESFGIGETDAKLGNIEKLNDEDDNRTPDFIIKVNEREYHVIELTTTRSDRVDILEKTFETKNFSYYGALQNRMSNKVITFTIIVVSPNRIKSSIPLPESLVNEIMVRMRISLALEYHAEMIHLDLEDDERSELRNRIKSSIEGNIKDTSLKVISDNPLLIDKDFIDSCLVEGDEKAVIASFIKELICTKEEILDNLSLNCDDQIKTYIDEFDNIENRRSDKKPISIFPFINIKEEAPSSDIPKVPIAVSQELRAVTRLWSLAMDYYEISPLKEEEKPDDLLNEALEEDLGTIKIYEEERKKKRRQYHRVDLRGILSEEELEEVALQGLWAKKYRQDDFMKARRKHQQAGFSWNTQVGDIEEYLNSMEDLDNVDTLKDPAIDLLSTASQIAGNKLDAINILSDWKKTSLFQAHEIISDIAYEVAIANKQHCRSKEMILKKLRRYNIYLLISPTKSSEHAFVSLYFPKPCSIKYPSVFGNPIKVLGGYVTDFFSIKQGKLENQSSMPASIISLASFWSWFYNLEDASPNSFKNHPEAYYMLKFSLLIRLEDKAQTEETITQTRYMYMEIFKGNFSVRQPDPFKILSKLTTYPRSRLNLFCLKKIIQNFRVMYKHPPSRILNTEKASAEDGEDTVPNDSWSGLLNWISGCPVPTATKSINLVYLGYLKNKMESAEGNTDFQLVEKTCEEEFKLDWSNIKASRGETETRPKEKQFNKNHIIHGCDMLVNRLKLMMGNNWQEMVRKDVLDYLSSKMTLEIATLKASSSVDHNDYNKKAHLSNDHSSKRLKVLEAIAKKIEMVGLNPLTHIKDILIKIETSSKGVICDLFKKQQHGGLREIYVLTIESRILQLFIESISRVLCSYFEEETLTHPKNKLRKLDQHRSNSARIANRDGCTYADFCSSTDKTRWNQNLMMTALSIPLLKLTPSEFHPIITRILNLWTLKLIKLPQRVCNLLLNSVEMKSDTYKKLHEEFWNPSQHSPFITQMGEFITLSSGMMQGILHYTSSLLHLAFLNSMNHIIPPLLKKVYPDHSFMMTQVCSSDDSATILSVFSPKGQRDLTSETYKACKRSTQVLEALNNMAPYYCMKNSVKSTTSVADYVEFNSEFLFKNTIAIPIIKFVAASLNLTESESYLERFHTQYNLISDLFSSGFPAINTHLCQLAQGYNHYRTMGSTVNPTFDFWSKQVIKLPDPILGFFLIDTEFCPGVLGFSYSYWKCAKETQILRRSLKSMLNDYVEVIDSGGVVQSLLLKYGEVKRWKSMVNEVSANVDFKEVMEEHPEILFREPSNMKELQVALAIKSTMPSVAKSMRRGNPYMQALAMSVYSINTHCFSKTSIIPDLSGKLVRTSTKVSLLQELMSRIKELDESPGITQSQISVTFPAAERYEEAQKIINLFKHYTLVKCSSFRNRRSEVYVQPFSMYVPLSLMQTCQFLWFGFKVKTSHTITKRCIDAYKSKLPWLKDTIKETLQESPFSTYQELANFISSQAIKTRTYVRIGPGLFSKRLTGQLFQLIRKSQRDGYVLRSSIKKEGFRREYSGTADIISRISLALLLPGHENRYETVKRLLKTNPNLFDNLESIQKMSKRDANLCYIQGYLKNEFSMEEIANSIQQTGNGLLFSYTKMQEKVETEKGVRWRGRGQCFVCCENSFIVVNMNDDVATSIEISSWSKMRGHPSTMSSIFRELKLKPVSRRIIAIEGNLVSKFDGSHWVSPTSIGTPIYENKLLQPRFSEPKSVIFKVGYQSISLEQKTPRGYASMIRFKTYPGDILTNSSNTFGTALEDCWLNQKFLKEEHATGHLLNSQLKQYKFYYTEDMKSWMIDTLISRLSQKGLCKGPEYSSRWIPRMELNQQNEEIEISEEDLQKLGLEMFEHDDSFLGIPLDKLQKEWIPYEPLIQESQNIEEDTELATSWAFIMHNWKSLEIEENVDITSKGVKEFKYLHVMWDKFIEKAESDHPGFWEKICSGYEYKGVEELSKCLIKMMGLKLKEAPKSLTDRGKLKMLEIQTTLMQSIPTTSRLESSDERPSWYEEVIKEEEEALKITEEEEEDLDDIYSFF